MWWKSSRIKTPTFLSIGIIGVVVALLFAFSMSIFYAIIPVKAVLVLFFTSSITFILIAYLTKILTGQDDHVMLRNFIGALILNYLVLNWFSLAILPALDVFAIGYGIIIMIGRIGCYKEGCCHGRPCSVGIRYGDEHLKKKGLVPYYNGVKLFPIQLVESIGLVMIVVLCTYFLMYAEQGSALTSFICAYALLRCTLEFFRGDPERKFLWRFSEAQWTLLFLVLSTAIISLVTPLPFYTWQWIVLGTLMSLLIIGILIPCQLLKDVRHIDEIMSAIEDFNAGDIQVITTSKGINISRTIDQKGHYYFLSQNKGMLNLKSTNCIGDIIAAHHPGLHRVVICGEKVNYILFY